MSDEVPGETVPARPHPALRPGVISHRGIRTALGRPRRRLETPIAAATLLLGFEQPVRISRAERAPVNLVAVVNGLTTAPALGEHGGRISGVEVLLAPWAPSPCSARNSTNWPTGPLRLRSWVRTSRNSPPRRPHCLPGRTASRCSARCCCAGGGPTIPARRGVRARSLLGHSRGAIPVRRPAEDVGWSVRHLENRFREQIGLSPKAAARVLRLQRARRLPAAGHGQAETAAVCGFYDQAHFSGEFKAMTGCTPGEFLAARRLPTATDVTDRLTGEAASLLVPADRSALFSKTRAGRSRQADLPALRLTREAGI
ncbi:helix-turn-helix domain-containing protein [Streptomyces sp. NPDC052301]|uniref:helix-turn-helix domain-containing protein n=1 Tax=Streptomyces sp. NPDC052301 TaxID=3365687 RepID=UPI0037D518F5